MDRWLFKQIDNTSLVLWRVAFGLLIALEGFGAIATGWVRRTMVEPEFTFNFIGFEFLQPLPGNGMYFYFALMGCFGVMVMLGYKYRFSMAAYALMWTSVYLMQKTSYNNHYYLMMLLCWIMVFLPANRWLSIDARKNPAMRSTSMPNWVRVLIISLLFVVYTYASVAKWYPDWLNATVPSLLMKSKSHFWFIGEMLQQEWVHWCIAYVGILFDLLIVPLLLWRKTRMPAFIISIGFHLFNSFVFHIGIFPYMSIAFSLFFFTPQTLIKRFLPGKPLYSGNEVIIPTYHRWLTAVLGVFLIVQIALPLRHHFFKDDVLWTEEGHRLSWRMMLRIRKGILTVWVEDKATGKRERYNYGAMLSSKQTRSVQTKPDLMWQLAQRIKQREAENGRDVAVYMDVRVKINDGNFYRLIDPETDLASVPWQPLKHHSWILPSPKDLHAEPKKDP
jgi:hypothetical protein